MYGAVGSIRAQSSHPERYLGTCLLLDSCTDLCLPSDFQLCWMSAGPWLSDALCRWPLCWKLNIQHLSLHFHWIKNASLIGCIFLFFLFFSKLDHEQILSASFGLQLLPSQWSEAALSCTGQCQQMLPKHLAARVNVPCLTMWSDFVKIAPSYSTNLPPVCLQVTPSSSPDKNKCLVLSAQLMQLGEGSCSLLCFKQQQQSSGWGTSCWVWRQRRSVCFWVLRWHCQETEKKTGLWLVTWKADMKIKIPAVLCLQTEAERVQQQDKRLLQWCRVLEMKALGLLHFESPVYKILAPRTSALHWLSNLYS